METPIWQRWQNEDMLNLDMMKVQQNSAATPFLATKVLQASAELAGNMIIQRLEGKYKNFRYVSNENKNHPS